MTGLLSQRRSTGARGLLDFGQSPRTGGNGIASAFAALADAGAAMSGRQGGNLAALSEEQRSLEAQSGFMAALNSPDPEIRARAEVYAATKGINTAPLQQMQAQRDMPRLMAAMKPNNELKPITATIPKFSIPTAGGGTMEAGGMEVSSGSAAPLPGLSFQDALAEVDSPALTAKYGDKLIEAELKGPDSTTRTGINPATGKLGTYVMQSGKPIWLDVGVVPEAPKSRTIRQGGVDITQEFQPDGTWREIARGAAFKPETAASDTVVVGNQLVNRKTGEVVFRGQGKPLPASLQKEQDADIAAIQTARAITKDLGAIREQMKKGELVLSPMANAGAAVMNYAGQSNANSRNIASFKSTLERLRNDSLRLNKGVQTDGDAQRAWNELFENINDQELVMQRLGEIEKINTRAAELRAQAIDLRRNAFGLDPFDASQINPGAALGGGAVPRPRTDPRGLPQKPSGKTIRFEDLP